MDASRNVRLTISIPSEAHERLKVQAFLGGTTVAAIVKKAIEDTLDRREADRAEDDKKRFRRQG